MEILKSHLNHNNIREFQKYLCQSNKLLDKIVKAYKTLECEKMKQRLVFLFI